tara:strand:- start:163 stop:423 length:261 start_codon:yes stop_codon:yes gene_type:complete
MKKVHRKLNLITSIFFLIVAYYLYNYIESGKWKYITPCILIFLSIGNFMISFEKYTKHEKKYPDGFGAMIYFQGLKSFFKDINKKK